MFKISTGKTVGTYNAHSFKVTSVCFTNEKNKALSGSDDRNVKYWDVDKEKCLKTISC